MIDKKELRIGNSVSYKGEVYAVLEIGGDLKCMIESKLLNRTWWILYETLDPIPITEEALVKMEWKVLFKGKNIFTNAKYLQYLISTKDNRFYIDISATPFNSNLIELKAVHQLQNIIYALTQTELTHE